jgi:hypothetical protein
MSLGDLPVCQHPRSPSPAFAYCLVGMVKVRSRKSVRRNEGRISKTSDDAGDTAESALQPNRRPAPSVKRRSRRTKLRRLK